jgi:diguanylate cyclase (GGDEF)-like protein
MILVAALLLNQAGKYNIAVWLTTFCMVSGPWGSILLDETVSKGDFVPLVYIALSIQLCSILLSERATFAIAIFQLGALAATVLLSPGLMKLNLPSLFAFIVFAATLGIISSFTNRKQIEQIEKQRNQLQKDEIQLKNLSNRDSLTALYNRRYMELSLDKEIEKASKNKQSLGIIMVDVDHFKTINDTMGHAVGDCVLNQVASILLENKKSSDIACRFGGDEFVLILPGCALEEALKRAEDIRQIIEKTDFKAGGKTAKRITLSFGVSTLPDHGKTREELLRSADNAMYSAKEAGRNRVVSASDGNRPVRR